MVLGQFSERLRLGHCASPSHVLSFVELEVLALVLLTEPCSVRAKLSDAKARARAGSRFSY